VNPDASPWSALQRIESWAGEVRVNLIRLAAIIAFYGYHLINYFAIRDANVTPDYHAAVTALILLWSCAIVLLHLCLSRRFVPPWLKFAATVWDVLMVTGLLMLPDGPRSPLAVLYFLVIAAAPLRLSLPLVYVATLASMGGYLIALGYYAFVLVGYEQYYANPAVRIPRTQEIIFLLALGAAGLLAGQVVRQIRRLEQGYPVTAAPTSET